MMSFEQFFSNYLREIRDQHSSSSCSNLNFISIRDLFSFSCTVRRTCSILVTSTCIIILCSFYMYLYPVCEFMYVYFLVLGIKS